MLNAHEVVNINNVSISAAAKEYGVPRVTLSDRVKGKVPMDAKMGRPSVLGDDHEAALVRYINYMADHRYPITRTQVIGLAWVIALRQGNECFNRSTGPSLNWWRGFTDRHPELSLRKPELVDHGRVANATPDIIGNYFDVLHATLEGNGLMEKPHQIYNCDEAAIFLNRTTEKVLVPIKSKHCHALAQDITVLCCINAGGGHVPPLLIF